MKSRGRLAEIRKEIAELREILKGYDPEVGDAWINREIGDPGRCTDTAQWLRRRLGGTVYGYQHDDNPSALLGEREFGHDFLVVDGRWIVDWWALDYYPDEVSADAVTDMKTALGVRRARKLYGDRANWVRVPDWPADHFRHVKAAMPRTH